MFHYEAVDTQNLIQLIQDIHRAGMKAGMAIKPTTEITPEIIDCCHCLDMILIMTVEPGFGGQKFMSHCLEKVGHIILDTVLILSCVRLQRLGGHFHT